MKYLKEYKIFESSQNYGIGDWIEDLKNWEWSRTQILNVDLVSLKKWSDHFIGEGYFEKILELTNRIIAALKKVDIEYIEDRMLDVYDKVPKEKNKWVMYCVAYGDYKKINKANKHKFNGLISVRDIDERDKTRIIIHIMKEIVYPTLRIGGYPDYFLRQSDESYYVTDKKWQCQNFNIDDYKEMGVFAGAEFDTDDYKGRKVRISEYEIDEKRDYSVDKILQMYKPCITIDIGSYTDSMQTGTMKLSDLESNLDEVLESILPYLDYEEVIWDKARFDRQFSEDTQIHDYTLKILLNF